MPSVGAKSFDAPAEVAVRAMTVVALVLFASTTPLFGQSSAGPLAEIVDTPIKSSNIFLLWQERPSPSEAVSFQKVYRFDASGLDGPVDERFRDIPARQDERPVAGNRHMAVTSGRFVVGPFDYVVAAWEGRDRSIELMIPHLDTTEAMWQSRTSHTVAGPVVQTDGNNERGRIFVESGDFTGSGLDEFALVYHGADSAIHVQVYDLDDSLSPRLRASINDETLFPVPIENARISVGTGDVTGNGRDEIVLASVERLGAQEWAWGIYVKLYRLDQSDALVEHARTTVFLNDPGQMQISGMDIAVRSGYFRDDSKQDIVLAMTFSTNRLEDDTFIYLLEVDGPQEELRFDGARRLAMQKSTGELGNIGLAVGDLNQDGRDEFVFALGGSFDVYSIDSSLNAMHRTSGPSPHDSGERLSYDFIAIDNLDMRDRPEVIIVASNYDPDAANQWFEVVAYTIHDVGGGVLNNVQVKGRRSFDQPAGFTGPASARRFAISTGNYNGYSFRLGQPTYSVETNIVQPIVILNAPPVHFDVFDGVVYDINRCYSGASCGFIASYEKTSASSVEISTQVRSDWGLSNGVGASGSVSAEPLGLGISLNYEAYLDFKYGRNFSNVDTESYATSISVAVHAVEDDIIYATVTDYDVWEYPSYHGSESEPRYHVMVVRPRKVEARWFPSKSWSASSYIPDHEIGNVLSYPAYPDFAHNPNLDQRIRASYSSDTFVLDANTNYSWSVNAESFNSSQADTSRVIGFDFKNHLATYRESGNYSNSTLSTHRTSVREGLNIKTQLGGIDRTFGETRYHVTPYSYWAKNGALVVDYAVRPEVSGPGGIRTWWDDRYGQRPDPAFVLPWRYDPEKGFGISEEAKRHQTQDVFFDFAQPVAGDTLTITARVRNFSLLNSPPVTVHFYLGDPDDGGSLIVGVGGETSVSTAGGIPAQRFQDVETRWSVPAGLEPHSRIYAVLNRDGGYDEIHLNNNKGFNVLGQGSAEVSVDPVADRSGLQAIKLWQAYPNPAGSAVTIRYALPGHARVRLEIYNVLGQRVAVLMDDHQTEGFHETSFDVSHLPGGLYVYRITTGMSSVSQRLVVLR